MGAVVEREGNRSRVGHVVGQPQQRPTDPPHWSERGKTKTGQNRRAAGSQEDGVSPVHPQLALLCEYELLLKQLRRR